MTEQSADTLVDEIHSGIVLLQRKNRKIRVQTPFPVSSSQSIFISYYACAPTTSVAEFSEALGYTKGKVARIIADLEKQGYLRSRPSPRDRRSRDLFLTPLGEDLLRQADQLFNQIAWSDCENLSLAAQAKACDYLERFSLGMGGRAEPTRPQEDPLVPRLRQLARVTGMIGDNYMESGLEVLEFQVIFELSRAGKGVGFGELAAVMPFAPSRLSRILDMFQHKGLLVREESAEDRRLVTISLTEQGKSNYQSVNARIQALCAKALSGFSWVEKEEFRDLLGLMTSPGRIEERQAELRAVVCRNEVDRKRGRAFLVEQLVRASSHYDLPADLLPATSLCTLLVSAHGVEGLVELLVDNSVGRVRHMAFGPTLSVPQNEAFGQCLDAAMEEPGITTIETADGRQLRP